MQNATKIILSILAVLAVLANLSPALAADGGEARVYPEGSEQYRKGDPAVAGPEAAPPVPTEPTPAPASKAAARPAAAPIAIDVKPQATEVERYQPLFATLTMAVAYANPYDQKDVLVDLVATTPSGKTVIQPCFFKSGTTAGSTWEARWTPREDGEHTYVIKVLKNGEVSTSAPQTLKVNPSNRDGFLHMDTAGSHFTFRFDSGKPWRGVGENFGWQGGRFTFEVMFALLKQNNSNVVRTWKGPGMYYLEQATGRVGWYNADTAARLDQIVKLAEQSGLYMMPTLDPVIEFKTAVDGWSGEIKWQKNPYSNHRGGPCNSPLDFFSQARPKEIYKNRLRYYVARWGYSPYVAFHEFWNEVDWANIDEKVPTAVLAEWHREMAAYLKSIDPYGKPVTSSLSHSDFADLWSLKDMDFTQRHLYGSMDQHATFLDSYTAKYKKPYVTGEFSLDYRGVTQHTPAAYENEVHKGLWRGMFTPTPILPMTWWWDFHADQNDYFHFLHARTFSEKTLEGAKILNLTAASGPANVEVRAFKSERGLFAWVNNRSNTNMANVQVKVRGGRDAAYEWRTFNAWTGAWGQAANIRSTADEISISLPTLAAGSDIALSFLENIPVALADRQALPRGWSARFDASTGRLFIDNLSAEAAALDYALLDTKGRTVVSGSFRISANSHANPSLDLAACKPGLHVLALTVGAHRVTRRVTVLP